MADVSTALKRRGGIDSDRVVKWILAAIASVAVLALAFIILFIAESALDMHGVGFSEFITGQRWLPNSGLYGAASIIVGTLLVTAGAVLVAFPAGLALAIYLSEMAPAKVRRFLKPAIELFAGIPSVVYGFLGLIVLVPFLADLFPDQTSSGFCWLAGSLLLGLMALPEIVSVSDDALRSVPDSYREASLGLGATRWETIRKVIVPAASSGVAAAAILGIGRAVGETMAVLMVTGNTSTFPEPIWNVFDTVRTLTATIAIEMPESVFGSVHSGSLFVLAIILMIIIFAINLGARAIVSRSERKFTGAGPGKLEVKFKSVLAKAPVKLTGAQKDIVGMVVRALVVLVFLFMILSLFYSNGVAAVGAVALTAVFILAGRFMPRFVGRKATDKISYVCLTVLAGCIVVLLLAIIVDIVSKGLPAIDMDFLTEYPRRAGREGGIYPAIVGTLELLAGTALIALPVGILSGTFLTEYESKSKLGRVIRDAVDVLNGTPSIVFGLFGLSALVTYLGLGVSLIAGVITLAIMVLPVIIRTTQEAVSQVPQELRDASRALGATKSQTVFKVVMPAAISGIITGAVLSLGRAAGETAPIMFTCTIMSQTSLSTSIFEPVMALPYHLYYLATEGRAGPEVMYATATILLVIVLSMFALATVVRILHERKMR